MKIFEHSSNTGKHCDFDLNGFHHRGLQEKGLKSPIVWHHSPGDHSFEWGLSAWWRKFHSSCDVLILFLIEVNLSYINICEYFFSVLTELRQNSHQAKSRGQHPEGGSQISDNFGC